MALLLVWVMMPFTLVKAEDKSLEISFTAAINGTVTYSILQENEPAIAEDKSETNTYTIDDAKDVVVSVYVSANDGYRVKGNVDGWEKDANQPVFKKTLSVGSVGDQIISGEDFIETVPDNEGHLTVDVTGYGKVSYTTGGSTKDISSSSSTNDKKVDVSASKEFTITPDNGNYIKSVKFDGTDVTFDASKLSGVAYLYEYTVEQDAEEKSLAVEFESLDLLNTEDKDITDFLSGVTVRTENNVKKVYVKNEAELIGANISDGTGAFGPSISIAETTTVENVYQLNATPTGFGNVVLAYSVNVAVVVDKTAPVVTANGNTDTFWVNDSAKDNVTVSGTVEEANLESLKWGLGVDCVPDQPVSVNEAGQFEVSGIDASLGTADVKFVATDKAGNSSLAKVITVKVDGNAPTVETEVKYNNSDNVFEKVIDSVRQWITKKDASCKIVVSVTDTESGVDAQQTTVKLGTTTLSMATNEPEQDGNKYIYTFDNVDVPTSSAVISVSATDKVGNSVGNATSGKIRKDNKAPELFVGDDKMEDDNNDGEVEYTKFYKSLPESSSPVTVDVRATDDIGLNSYSITGTGITTNIEDDYAQNITSESDFVTSTRDSAKIVTADNTTDYTALFTATDLAGNTTNGKVYLKQDNTAPTVALTEITSVVDIEGESYYYTNQKKISVTVQLNDEGVGLKTVNLYDGNEIIASRNVSGLSTICTFRNVAINGTHELKVEAIDELDNISAKEDLLPNHNNIIKYDASVPVVTFVTNEEAHDTNGNPLFADETVVKSDISDVNAGIAKVSYSVVKPVYDTTPSVSNKSLYEVQPAGEEKGIKKTKATSKSMSKNIIVDGNSNDIQLIVDVTDGAGNVITLNNIKKISIDKIAPTIDVSYDNNSAESGNRYRANRTATITVTERNFNANDFKLNITNTAGSIPAISEWTTVVDETNPDNNKHIATVSFTADGDYTMDMSYADMVGNVANKIATQSFTIDKNAPAINVSFDNNSSLNDHYYASGRTATITVDEHYFDANRVTLSGTATNDGNTLAFPEISGWTSNGDVHTATVHFATDGNYQFNVIAADQAGNTSPEFVVPEFVVDQTAPTITFGGVEDQASYNDVVEPTVTFEDVNYDTNNVDITLVGANQGQVNFGSGASDSNNGQTMSFSDFEHKAEVDDIYTLTATITDMAGNSFEDSITFSVNRFGSNYELDDSLKAIQGKYIKEAIDVVFTETNVNTLADGSSKIVVSANGTPKTLEAGSDYQVSNSGGAGSWSRYTYTIPKNAFAADGSYIISVYSEDTAGNINENTADGKEAEISFGVDATAPVIAMANLEENGNYNATSYEATVNVSDNLVLDNVSIELNGRAVEAKVSNDNYTFNIPESSERQTVTVIAKDAAGNELTQEVSGIVVTTNALVRFFNNTKVLVGTAVGVIAVGGAGTFTFINGGIGAFRFRPKKIKITKK